MKEIMAFIRKEFMHIFRDLRTMLIVLVMPVVQIVLFGFAISTEVHNAVIDVVGDVHDPAVQRIVERIDNNEYLQIGKILSSPSEIDARIHKGKAIAAVCFDSDFDSKLNTGQKAVIHVVCDGTDPNTSQVVTGYIRGVLATEQVELIAQKTGQTAVSMRPNVQLMYNPAMNSSYNFVPGVMGLILMLICSMMTAVSIVREKELGTMELVLVSPVKPFWIILSKIVPYLVLSAINFVSVLLLAHYVMGVPVNGSLALLSFEALLFIGSSLGIGLLISIISKTQQTAMLLCGMGLTMPTMMLSGIIFPCESMPVALQVFSDIIPAKWFIIIVKRIMIQGAGLSAVLKETLILGGMMVFLLGLSIKKFKNRL
ncbi:MAG: ABC transporter permease [Candidatus Cryptobacteroides sp.]